MNTTRYNRLAQQKHRGSARSYVTEIENLKVIVAWAAGMLSEGQATKALGVDRIAARTMYDTAIEDAMKFVEASHD